VKITRNFGMGEILVVKFLSPSLLKLGEVIKNTGLIDEIKNEIEKLQK
jgi:hypothetical protein